MIEKDKNFLWNLMPDWVKKDEPGLCPTMYGTGTYAGDGFVRKRVQNILAGISTPDPLDELNERAKILRRALRTPEGIDAIMEHSPSSGLEFRKFLQEQADKVDELSETELWALSIVIGLKRIIP